MPPHHKKKMWDWWWADLPPKAKAAAKELGFTPEIWDADEHVPYEEKSMPEVTKMEKSAALYLGLSPIDQKCDIYWEEADETTQKYAQVIGWDQHRWDHDWDIRDLPIEHKYWAELSDEEKEAAEYFGYCQVTWDEVDEEDQLPNWGEEHAGEHVDEEAEEKKDDEEEPEIVDDEVFSDEEESDEVEEVPDEEAAAAAGIEAEEEKPKKKKKVVFKKSKAYGGGGGGAFNFGNNRHIEKIVIYHDRHVVKGISLTTNGGEKTVGSTDDKKTEIEFDDDEFITHVKVRSNAFVQSLTFRTNMGRTIGPMGGKGWRFGSGDRPGQEISVPAPFKRQLCGLSGKCGAIVDSIVFHWGPVPSKSG